MRKSLFVLIEKDGIRIPKVRLEDFNEGDVVGIEIKKVFIDKKDREDFIRKFV